jgi:hypothetical protein
MLTPRIRIPEIPMDICEVLAGDLISEAPELPKALQQLRSGIIALQRREEEIEAFAISRAKSSVGLTLKFASRTSGKGDYLDKLGVGRKEVFVYQNGKWRAVKNSEIQGLLTQFLDEKQYKRWLYSYKLRLLLLSIYFYLGRVLEMLGIIEFVKVA